MEIEDSFDLWLAKNAVGVTVRKAYNAGHSAGLSHVLKMMEKSEDGDWDFLKYQIENLLKENANAPEGCHCNIPNAGLPLTGEGLCQVCGKTV